MSFWIEVVFDSVSMDAAVGLARDVLTASSGSIGLHIDTDEVPPDLPVGVVLGRLDSMAYYFVAELDIGGVAPLVRVRHRVVRHSGGSFDVEVNFDTDDLDGGPDRVGALHAFSTRLARKHGVETYYGGIEPAVDLDTRMFTGRELGPVRFRT
jgi:hypothetical protein